MLVAVFALVIVALLWALIFYNPAPAASHSVPVGGAGTVNVPSPIVSPDGRLAVTSMSPDEAISSPLTLRGTVTGGGWFFEGSFPVKIVDGNGVAIGTTTAHAEGDWMTTSTVPWSATLVFPSSSRGSVSGTVVFMSDNPSGNPANQKTLSVPVRF